MSSGLVDLMTREGLYNQNTKGVSVSQQVLYQARIALPSSVQTGTYTAETFAISHGRVVASAISRVEVQKQGFELMLARFADQHGLMYGLIAVVLSIGMGFLAGRFFALV